MRGRFITVEGVEGVGKSTNIAFIADLITAAGHRVQLTREPGGTALGEEIRALLLRPGATIDPLAELLLVFAARAAHVREVIEPALADGAWVVCDRFTDASYAYQGAGRGIPATVVAQLEAIVVAGLRPDLTLLLDAPPAVTGERLRSRAPADRFEQEGDDFFARVRRSYLERAGAEPGRIRTVRADQPLPAVRQDLAGALAHLLESA